ncbi:DoxX family protein [Verrucomicrobium sp. 3C]|uniref:DoxX family protein n=1 Tax=Verrucomicrobium sp. 3C TaxID=1134055 RepID=UPI0003723505|nr:TQO small subunit DoxD [Verrucomicrobium sp. 3C]
MTVADRWLAVLRILTGLLFVESGVHKLSWAGRVGGLPTPAVSERWQQALPKRLLEFAEKNPIGGYRAFLYRSAIPNRRLIAALVAWGELLLGLSLAFGLLARLASFAGFFLAGNYFLADYWMGPCQRNLGLLLLTIFLVLGSANAGRYWGVDRWLFPPTPKKTKKGDPAG